MELEAGTRAIVALAWARRLGLSDSALHPAALGYTAPRVAARDDDAGEVRFLRLLRGSALAGPGWFVDAAEGLDDDELARETTLLRLIRTHGGAPDTRGTGETGLYYLDEPFDLGESESALVTTERGPARELEAACPRDDVAAGRLSRHEHTFTLVSEQEHVPLAGAGYTVWEGLVADVSVLTVPELRRHGLGTYIAGAAVQHALAQGLVPQWRAPSNQRAAHLTADNLGFVLTGSLTGATLH